MRTRLLSIVSAICLVVTVVWLILFIYSTASAGTMETPEQALAAVSAPDALFYATYINATLVTLSATMLFAGLYVICKPWKPIWAAMGLAFVPIYATLNLFAYLSQIAIVPRLTALRPESNVLLAQMVQQWPGSAVNILNNIGYAVLGIPSIIFGLILPLHQRSLRLAGILLALSGAASIVGIMGIVAQSDILSTGSVAGGVLFLAALVPLTLNLTDRSSRKSGG